MPGLIAGAIWAGLVAYLLTRALRQFRNYQHATISAAEGTRVSSPVSVIVPARNEVDNIDLCLAGLSAQTGLDRCCIIVVDDNSVDGTKTIAERRIEADPRIRVVDAGPLPAGWAGKPHACWRGAALADGDWLCFVDADVRAAPPLIAAAITAAETRRVDMLSLHPRQALGSFWERLVIPAGMLVLACAKRFDPASQDIVNGQFLLVRREAYFDVGGHAAVRNEICEDLALAARIKAHGFGLLVMAADNLAETRMYRDLGSLWEGFLKNAAEALGSVRATLLAAVATLIFGWAALLLPLGVLWTAIAQPSLLTVVGAALALVGSAVLIGIHIGTARHFRIPVVFSLMFSIGYTAVACLACHSVITQLSGRVTWKGRTYRVIKTAAGGA